MKLYLSIIGAAMALIGAVNIAFDTASAIYVVVAVILCTALQFALDGLIAPSLADAFFYLILSVL